MSLGRVNAWMLLLGPALLLAASGLSLALAVNPGDALTRNSIRLSLAWYLAALLAMLFCRAEDWSAETPRGALARWCWTWAVVCFIVHLGLAFHFVHGWSHSRAFEKTLRVAGVGEGVYVSYLFTVLWLVDLLCWWLAPRRYAARSVWIDRTLHAFMLFIVFNGSVVYEAGPIRWVALVSFGVLAACYYSARWRPRWSARSSWEV
ncbi:MAG: hypothetical protein JSS27_20540 [Planctomycetes bacterium]|nr:hypothetical protein [Planctomycetota bacterium]